MTLVRRVRRSAGRLQLTGPVFPAGIRHRFGLDQPGAQVEVIERQGEIVLRPHGAVPADQAWFWAERWQQMERDADDAIAAGRIITVEGVEELLADLDS